ncbi:MAG: calcium/sodium antiporter [Nanoarchaeales archaeon]|nr:calcium/sodium antiporter [Nanoarchaeales archaeon]
MSLIIHSTIIIITSILIYYLGEKFAKSSTILGNYFHLSKSVKGATFDAIAGSMPELMVALFSVIFFAKFEVGIGTIAGSALFNLLIIPGICVLVSKKVFRVSKEVLTRDALFYLISIFILLVLVIYAKTWGFLVALILIGTYFVYLHKIVSDSKKYNEHIQRAQHESKSKLIKELVVFFGTMFAMGLATYFLTDAAIKISEILSISPIIIAFTVIAAATSIPDTVISVYNAKRGRDDDAMSNVFGSNIFDILIGLGLPLVIYVATVGTLTIVFEYKEIIFGLLGATIMLFYFMMQDNKLEKKEGVFLLLLYVFFVVYVVSLAL